MKALHIKLKQINLNVRFLCHIKAYFKFENKQYPIDEQIKLTNGKVNNFNVFSFKQQKNENKSEKITSGFLEIYLESNSGKLKILTRQIKFSELKQGDNDFQHKFDNCPDKNANISYTINYQSQIKSPTRNNNIENTPMTESHYTDWTKDAQKQLGIHSSRQNSYAESNLLSNKRLNNFIEKLQKKSVKKFSNEVRNRTNSKTIESDFIPKNSPILPKSSLLRTDESENKRRNSYSDIKENKINNQIKKSQSQYKVSEQITIQQTKVHELIQEIKLKNEQIKIKNEKIQQFDEVIKSLNQKFKSSQIEIKRVNHENLLLKSTIQRLQDKINAHKQKYEGITLTNENNLNRFSMKQSQYRQQIKNVTQKAITIEYQKQKLRFENETLMNEIQSKQQKFRQQFKKQNRTHQQQINELKKRVSLCQQTIQGLNKQKSKLQQSIKMIQQKNELLNQQIKNKTQQEQGLYDQISSLKLQIQRLNSKLLLYSHTLQSQKVVVQQFVNLKTQYTDKQELINKLQLQNKLLKNNIQLLLAQKQKLQSINIKQVKSVQQLVNKNKLILNQKQQINLIKQSLQIKIKSLSNQIDSLLIQYQNIKQDKTNIQINLKQNILKLQNQIINKSNQISLLDNIIHQNKQQIIIKSTHISSLNKNIQELQENIQEITITIEKYQQKFINNQKINKTMENNKMHNSQFSREPSKLPQNSQYSHSNSDSQQNPLKKSDNRDLAYRIKKFSASLIYRAQQFAGVLQQMTQQKLSLQKQLNMLSQSLQKLHSQTIEQHSSLKGKKLSLQDKLSTNERLMTRMKLIIEQKNKQIQTQNDKLNNQIQKRKKLKQQLQLISKQLQQTKQSLQQKQHEIKKLIDQMKSKQLIRNDVQNKLKIKIKNIQSQFQYYKNKQIQINKIKSLELEEIKKNHNKANYNIQHLEQQITTLKQSLANSKLQTQKVNTLFVQIYKNINNIEKQGTTSSFLFIPLRQAVKKVQAQVAPKPASTLLSSTKLDKQKSPQNLKSTVSGNIRNTVSGKNPPIPQPPQLLKTVQSKISINSKDSLQKRNRMKSKDSQKS